MGDRRMAEIKARDGSIFVYTHNFGRVFEQRARDGIKAARAYLHDHSYATRIIVSRLIVQDLSTDGFGLMATPNGEDQYHNDKPSIIINLTTGTLMVHDHEHQFPTHTPFSSVLRG